MLLTDPMSNTALCFCRSLHEKSEQSLVETDQKNFLLVKVPPACCLRSHVATVCSAHCVVLVCAALVALSHHLVIVHKL